MKQYLFLVVDDESPARKKLQRFIKDFYPDCLIEEAEDGISAVQKINDLRPDVIFLDIQMPGMTGFEVIREIGAEEMPPVIFVTAYDQYALEAFNVQAIDYLLKPYDKERFAKALNRVIDQLNTVKGGDYFNKLNALLTKLHSDQPYINRILINERSKYFFITVEKIIFIKSCEKYVEINCSNGKYLLRSTMNDLEKKLDPGQFSRIHRSTIINLNYIKSVEPVSHGDYIVRMQNGAELSLSRHYRSNLIK